MEWIVIFLAGVIGVLSVLFKGRSEGREQEKAKQASEVLDNVKEAKSVADSVASDDADSRRQRMHDKFSK